MNDFRTIAQALAPHVAGNTYSLLDAADAVTSVLPDLDAVKTTPVTVPHDLLVYATLGNDDAMRAIRKGEKINAIKALRLLWPSSVGKPSPLGLKAAKDAVEDPRVMASWQEEKNDPWAVPQGDPWATHGNDEPPF